MAEDSPGTQRADGGAAAPVPPDVETQDGASVVVWSPLTARLDVVVAAVIATGAAAIAYAMPYLIASGGIDTERDFATLSGAFIPRLTFAILSVVSIVALLQAVARVRSGIAQPRVHELDRFARAGAIALVAVAYAASVTWLGYILATMLMTAVMAFYLGLRNPLLFIPGAVIVPIVIRFVFERMLLISLPRSSIESVGVVEDAVLRFLVGTLLQ